MNFDDVRLGMRVIYIPNHAQGNSQHVDCEHGEVVRLTANYRTGPAREREAVFVHYDLTNTTRATDPRNLVRERSTRPRMVEYFIPVYNDMEKPWFKKVDEVRPSRGNGFDIIGPFVKQRGRLPEGTLLCVGATYSMTQQKVYEALKVTHGAEAGLVSLAVSGALLREVWDRWTMEFPALHELSSTSCAPVWYALLKALREREQSRRGEELVARIQQESDAGLDSFLQPPSPSTDALRRASEQLRLANTEAQRRRQLYLPEEEEAVVAAAAAARRRMQLEIYRRVYNQTAPSPPSPPTPVQHTSKKPLLPEDKPRKIRLD